MSCEVFVPFIHADVRHAAYRVRRVRRFCGWASIACTSHPSLGHATYRYSLRANHLHMPFIHLGYVHEFMYWRNVCISFKLEGTPSAHSDAACFTDQHLCSWPPSIAFEYLNPTCASIYVQGSIGSICTDTFSQRQPPALCHVTLRP